MAEQFHETDPTKENLKKYHIFGLGGLFRVEAGSETEAEEIAFSKGLISKSWTCLAEKDSSFPDKPKDEYIKKEN